MQVQREACKKREGVAPTPPATPTTRAPQVPEAPRTLVTSSAPRTSSAPALPPTPAATLRIADECPSESDSESDSEDEDEEQGTGTADPWTAYQARWKDIMDNGVKEGIVSITEGILNPGI